MVKSFFPSSHGLCGLYSTRMEAAEFALRLARVVIGKRGVVGFERYRSRLVRPLPAG